MLLFWYKKKSRTHGFGLFANKNIKKNQKIIQYIGNKISKKEGDRIADKHLNKIAYRQKADCQYLGTYAFRYCCDIYRMFILFSMETGNLCIIRYFCRQYM